MLSTAARAIAVLGTGALALALAACAPIVRAERSPALAGLSSPIQKIAVAPFTAAGELARVPREGSESPGFATSLVAHEFGEALRTRVSVVPAADVGSALGLEGTQSLPLPPADVAALAARQYGADAVLLGRVARFVRREGEAAGTLRPASVSFTVSLHAAPGGERLWRADFDETQKALSENLFVTGRYPGGGTRWLTAEELARWGVEAAVAELPLGP